MGAGKSAPAAESVRVGKKDAQGGTQIVVEQREAPRDSYGNAQGHKYDLAVDGAFDGQTVKPAGAMTPIVYGSAGNLVTAAFERDGKRLIIDGGFTRLGHKWDSAGTGRYVKNAAAWLANHERFDLPAMEGGRVVKWTLPLRLRATAAELLFRVDAPVPAKAERVRQPWKLFETIEVPKESTYKTYGNVAVLSEPRSSASDCPRRGWGSLKALGGAR